MTVTFIAALLPVVLYIVLVYVLDRFALLSKVQLLVMVVLGEVWHAFCLSNFAGSFFLCTIKTMISDFITVISFLG